MHIHDCPLVGKNFLDILSYMQGGDILFQGFVCLDLHSLPEKGNLLVEGGHHIRIASTDQNIGHECHL